MPRPADYAEQLRDLPALECPLCDRVRKAVGFRKDGSVTYSCPPDHVNHGNRYVFRIMMDGSLKESFHAPSRW